MQRSAAGYGFRSRQMTVVDSETVMRFSLAAFMRSASVCVLAGFCALAMPRGAEAGYDFDEKGNAFVTGEAVIAFKPGTTLLTIKSILARCGADPSRIQFLYDQSALVRFDERKNVLKFCQQMDATGWTTASCPNYLHRCYGIPNDSYYSLQWGMKSGIVAAAPTVGADFQDAAGYVSSILGSGVKVAVIDTGVDLTHPELLRLPAGPLLPNTAGNYTLPTGAVMLNPGSIWGTNSVPRTLTQVDATPTGGASFPPYVFGVGAPNDDNGHGTHVTGIIAARTSNLKGVAGGAPASIIYPIKAGDRLGVFTDVRLANSIAFAATNGCRVINISLGNPGTGQVVTNAILFAMTQTVDRTLIPNVQFKGSVCVCGMGNDGSVAINYPAVLPGVVAVGAHDSTGLKASYSTSGEWITLVAPGGDGGPGAGGLADNAGQVFSTYPTYNVATGPPILPVAHPQYTNYSYMSGSSMAAAHVSAAAALLLQKRPYLSQAQVWAQLAMYSTHVAPINVVTSRTGATTVIPDTARNTDYGYGLLNANSLILARQPAIGSSTTIPHVFPFSPRNHFTYIPGTAIPLTNGTYVLTGLQSIDVVRSSATNTFRVIVVDDHGERIPNAQVKAHFTLLGWNGSPLGYPTSNVVDTVMLDNGTATQDDLLPSDCVYGCKIPFPLSFQNCLYEVRYIVTAPGMRPNTNRVVNIQVQ